MDKLVNDKDLAKAINDNPSITNKELAVMFGCKEPTIRLHKSNLRKKGLIGYTYAAEKPALKASVLPASTNLPNFISNMVEVVAKANQAVTLEERVAELEARLEQERLLRQNAERKCSEYEELNRRFSLATQQKSAFGD